MMSYTKVSYEVTYFKRIYHRETSYGLFFLGPLSYYIGS